MLKVAYVMGGFPAVSETFILHQLVGMARRGLEMEIHAVRPEPGAPVHALVEEFGLMRFVRYRPRHPRNPAALFAWTAWCFLRNLRHLSMMKEVFLRGRNNPYSRTFTYLSLADSLLRTKADVIHAQFGHGGRVLADLRQVGVFRAPFVSSFRGGDTTIGEDLNPERYRLLYRVGARLLPVSGSLAEAHVRAGCPEDKLEVHHSGLNLDQFPFRPFPGFHEPLRLLAVGRMVEKKGHRYALEALRLLRDRGFDARLTLVGRGPLESELRGLSARLGLGDRVAFAGWKPQDELAGIQRDSDILLAPSVTAPDGDREGIPNFVKESMAVGVPVVATRHGGIPELVDDGVSGLLVPERSAEAMAEAVTRLIKDPDRIAPMARAAREKVEREFDIEKLNDRLVEIYREGVAANR
jgi:colanic acid/amylovoran biosynthesis glycosyltransferase